MRFASISLLPLLLSLPLVGLAGPVEVTASQLNVRSGPGGSVLGQIPSGSRFVGEGRSGSWEAIDYAGRRAYVSARYLKPAQGAATLRITASSLNVRSGPSTNHQVLGQVSRDQSYVRLGGQEGWSKIQFDHREGWVSDRYLNQLGVADRLGGRSGSGGSGDATTTPGGTSGASTPPSTTPSTTPPSTTPPSTQPGGTSTLSSAYRGLTYMGAEIPRAGLYNSILKTQERYGSRSSFRGLVFVRGKVSWFGGASDTGVTRTETGTITGERLRSLNVPARPSSNDLRTRPGDFYYVAMRWDYRPMGRTFWRRARLVVASPSTGKMVVVRPVDWGPHTRTRRILDLSPQALRDLGIQTDAEALVAFVDPSTPLGVLR